MLEHQHTQLIAGVQELYRRLAEKEPKPDLPIEASCNGQPLTHRILEALNVVRPHEWKVNERSDDSTVSSVPSDDACDSPLPDLQPTSSSDSVQASKIDQMNSRLPVPYELTPPSTLTPPAAEKLAKKPTFKLQMPPSTFANLNDQSTDCYISGASGMDWLLDTSVLYGEPTVLDPGLPGF